MSADLLLFMFAWLLFAGCCVLLFCAPEPVAPPMAHPMPVREHVQERACIPVTQPSMAAIFGIPAVVRSAPLQRAEPIPMWWLDGATGEAGELVEEIAMPMLPGHARAN